MVNRSGLFALLQRIGCLLKLLKLIIASHQGMQRSILQNDASSKPFPIVSGVKQGRVLAPTLFGIFSLLLSYAFPVTEDGVYFHTKSDGGLFNLAGLRSKTKTRTVLIREMFLANDAALVAAGEQALLGLVDHFSQICNDFGFKISLKTQIMSRDTSSIPDICIGDHMLEVVENFVYLGKYINKNLALENEIN